MKRIALAIVASLALQEATVLAEWTVTTYKSAGTPITNLAAADSLIAGQGLLFSASSYVPLADLLDPISYTGEGRGRFAVDNPIPGIATYANSQDLAINATGVLNIPTSGIYTFGMNSDDGSRLRIDSQNVILADNLQAPRDTPLASIYLKAGNHQIQWTVFQHAGMVEGEVFAAAGTHDAFIPGAFALLGRSPGLTVNTQPPPSANPPAISTNPLTLPKQQPTATDPLADHLEVLTANGWQAIPAGSCPSTSLYDPNKPTVVLVHGWMPGNLDESGDMKSDGLTTVATYWSDAAKALAARAGKDINVVAWSWVSGASTREIPLNPLKPAVTVPTDSVKCEGETLAAALRNQLAPQAPVQLIGHSLGGKIAAIAAVRDISLPIDQLTTFDVPEYSRDKWPVKTQPMNLQQQLVMLDGTVFTDNYFAAFGTSYSYQGGGCVNINQGSLLELAPVLSPAPHSYPIKWYFGGDMGSTYADGTIDSQTSMPSKDLGAAWSVVLGEAMGREQVSGHDLAVLDTNHLYSLTPVERGTVWIPAKKRENLLDARDGWRRYGDVYFEDGSAKMVTNSPVYFFADISFAPSDTALQFTFKMHNPIASDRLTVWFGDELIYSFDGSGFPSDVNGLLDSDYIDISQYAGRSGTLAFCYNSEVGGQMVEIGNIDILAVPEPATLSLLVLGGLAVLRNRR